MQNSGRTGIRKAIPTYGVAFLSSRHVYKGLIINSGLLIYCEPATRHGKMSAEKAKFRTFVSSLRETISNLSSGLSPVYLLPPIKFDSYLLFLSLKKGDVCIRMRCWKKDATI